MCQADHHKRRVSNRYRSSPYFKIFVLSAVAPTVDHLFSLFWDNCSWSLLKNLSSTGPELGMESVSCTDPASVWGCNVSFLAAWSLWFPSSGLFTLGCTLNFIMATSLRTWKAKDCQSTYLVCLTGLPAEVKKYLALWMGLKSCTTPKAHLSIYVNIYSFDSSQAFAKAWNSASWGEAEGSSQSEYRVSSWVTTA